MSRTVYVNGAYLPEAEATVSVFDRGFLMADGVYEVTSVLDGKLIDFGGHCVRLARSLSELEMRNPHTTEEWLAIHRELVARNAIVDGMVYLQVTRGNPGDRDFAYPSPEVEPTVVLFTQAKPGLADAPAAKTGWRVITIPDLRWSRRDIKTVQLLYPSMGKMAAKKAGVDDSWFVEDGLVTEGTSNNAYIVKGNRIITRALSHDILHGITRAAVLRFAAEAQMEVEERSFSVEEAKGADEAFVTSASAFVMPVVAIDGTEVGNGKVGTIVPRLREIYLEEMRKAACPAFQAVGIRGTGRGAAGIELRHHPVKQRRPRCNPEGVLHQGGKLGFQIAEFVILEQGPAFGRVQTAHEVVAGIAIKHVAARHAGKRVVAIVAIKRVVARAAQRDIAAAPAIEHIVAAAARQHIITGIAAHHILCPAAQQQVIPACAGNHVVTGLPQHQVADTAAVQGVVAVCAFGHTSVRGFWVRTGGVTFPARQATDQKADGQKPQKQQESHRTLQRTAQSGQAMKNNP
jgi:D-alanine transaminase